MSTVEDRAVAIYNLLSAHLGHGFTLHQLCRRLTLEPGAKTTAAIKRARAIAVENGLHFPPAISPDYHYKVTNLPGDAMEPTARMELIAAGVERRADVGFDFMRAGLSGLAPEERALVQMHDTIRRANAQIRAAFNDAMIEVIKARRETREAEARAEANGQVPG